MLLLSFDLPLATWFGSAVYHYVAHSRNSSYPEKWGNFGGLKNVHPGESLLASCVLNVADIYSTGICYVYS